MNQALEDFIEQNKHKSSAELSLLLSKRKDLPRDFILSQVNGRRKVAKKFPFLAKHKAFVFPPEKAFAQSSSQETALYKSGLINAQEVTDLSGGMGIDSYFFSLKAKLVNYIEKDPKLAEITKRNFKTLEAVNIKVHTDSAESYIKSYNLQGLVYIDPDRRPGSSRAFKVEECEPNVAKILPLIWQKTNTCLIKLSPMLDVSQAISQLQYCKEVHIVSVNSECKELLFLMEKDFQKETSIKTINLREGTQEKFNFLISDEKRSNVSFSEPLTYLYEPNSSILKSGAFKLIAEKYTLQKLATHTHLYTSTKLLTEFPGRRLKILEVSKPQKGLVKKANIVARNFPMKPESIKKKYKIEDGGNEFLYACSLEKGNKVFIRSVPVN